MNFVVQWNLSGNAAAADGFVIQDIMFVWAESAEPMGDLLNEYAKGTARAITRALALRHAAAP
jgi:hypothetical protein